MGTRWRDGSRNVKRGYRRCRVLLLPAVALAVLAAVAGCGAGPPRSQAGEVAGEGFPVRLKDALGVEVTVGARPEQIVSVAPTVTEILFALGAGDRVAAVTDQCNYPPEVKELPRVGGWFTPSTERAIGARPDLVIGSRGNPPGFVSALRKSGCPVFTIDPKTVGDIFEVIGQIAAIIGEQEAGEELVREMRDRLDAVTEGLAEVPEEERVTAFIVLEVSTLYTAGSGTFQDDAIRAAGARNIAARRKGFSMFSTESLVAADPDFLLLSTMDGDPERMKREVLRHTALRRLSAVRGDGIVMLEADPIMRPGPRIVEAVEAMAEAFYTGRFGEN